MPRANHVVTSTLCGLIALAGCAAEPPAGAMPLLVKLAQPSIDAAAIAADASAASGHAVRYVSAVSEHWHALSLACGSAADCDAALQRLRADTARFAAVQRDERKRIVTP